MSDQPSQKDLHFRGQSPNEKILGFYRQHWITLLPLFATFAVIVVAFFFVAINFPQLLASHDSSFFRFIAFFACLLLLYFLHHSFLVLAKHHLSVTIVTNERIIIIHRSLFLINEMEMIDLRHIQEVKIFQIGVMQNIFRFGSLHVILSTTSENVLLEFVPNPDFHFRLINKAQQALPNRTVS